MFILLLVVIVCIGGDLVAKFDVFLPFDKVAKSDDNKVITISGYSSTGDRDYQGETIDPNGIHYEYLLDHGYIDYEHDTDQIIGVPTENTHLDSKGLFLEAKLFSNMKQVQNIMKLYKNIEENDIDRHLGFSIEGSVIERDDEDDSIIRQVQITGVAVTTHPANPACSWKVLNKSLFNSKNKSSDQVIKDMETMTAGYDVNSATVHGGAAFRKESFLGTFNNLVFDLKQAKKLGLETVATSLAEELEKNDADEDARVIFVQLFTGLSEADARLIVRTVDQQADTDNRLRQLENSINPGND